MSLRLPNLSRCNSRLALDVARAGHSIDSLAGRMEILLHPMQEQHWREVKRLSQWLAASHARPQPTT